MRVLITGAAGRLGSPLTASLREAGHDVVATDGRQRPGSPQVKEVNLLDTAGVAALMPGVEAVVHLGNYSGTGYRPQTQTLNENVAMNMNVFQAAIDAGVRKIVFASSIQVVSSESHDGTALPHAHKVAYLPLDADSPANPTNGYALSKLLGEVMLREYVAPCGIVCAAMRFPALRASAAEFETDFTVEGPHKPVRIAQGFALLTMNDAARSIIATLEAKLTGYHTFFPAISRVEGALVKPAIERYYPDVPLRRPIEQIDSLVCSRFIREATGWVPQDLF